MTTRSDPAVTPRRTAKVTALNVPRAKLCSKANVAVPERPLRWSASSPSELVDVQHPAATTDAARALSECNSVSPVIQ